ncbi:SET domain-containing protein [Candidatus Spongiihabitans sp.]|uniref:SET domain-containing protein n=1 Tax=Candidatus Spongiihabitans sp. TaxID=3101308 RepID=UPI003C7027C5
MVNHSSNENCRIKWKLEGDVAQAKLIAKRNIDAGEELFIRYYNIGEYDFE